jgi:hypothetical protein
LALFGIGALVGGVVGGALGVAVGALYGNPAQGAIYGAAMGAGVMGAEGAMQGATTSMEAKQAAADQQIQALELPDVTLNPQFSANGYIFLPTGQNYKFVEMLISNEETQQTETLQCVYHDERGVIPKGE